MRRCDLLLTLSEELSDLATATTAIQAALGEALQGAASAGQNGFWQLQEIDRLQQTLEDLSAILRAAAEDEGPRVDVERLARVARLGSLRERIRGATRDAASVQGPGTVAMF